VAKISAIASSLGSTAPSVPSVPQAPAPAPSAVPSVGKDPRLELLRALRPLVAEQKQKRIDDLVQIAAVASLLGNFGKRS
jgi:3-oxoacyl-ACP reductase-like protein